MCRPIYSRTQTDSCREFLAELYEKNYGYLEGSDKCHTAFIELTSTWLGKSLRVRLKGLGVLSLTCSVHDLQ